MDINVTLFGEMITFAVLVWVTMKYIWPPLLNLIQERQQKISSGLEAAERGQRELAAAQIKIAEELRQAKSKAATIIDQANLQANNFIEASKTTAQVDRNKMLAQTKIDLEQEVNRAKYLLRQQSVAMVIAATEKILQQKIDDATQKQFIDVLISKI